MGLSPLAMAGMMGGQLPPPLQNLLDNLPTAEELQQASQELPEVSSQVSKFLALLAQLLRQQALVSEAAEQTEPLKLECSECHMTFGVNNPLQYRMAIAVEGKLYTCANDHEPCIIGSGRLGELMEDELLAKESGGASYTQIYPPLDDEDEPENTDSGE